MRQSLLFPDANGEGDASDEANELLVGLDSYSDVPFLEEAWRGKSPLKKVCTVVEAERCSIVFDVV